LPTADLDVVAACQTLKEAGYTIALDDYVANTPREALAKMADIIKVEMLGAGQEKTSDLVLSALVRGRFGEFLAPLVQHGESNLFLLGLLSLIDAMMEMPMAEVLEKIPLDHATKAVLLGKPSELGPVFQLMLAHERGEWTAAEDLCRSLRLEPRGSCRVLLAGAGVGARGFERGVRSGFRLSASCIRIGENWDSGCERETS
jgi:c-di-GMP-related signal transduction protein